MKTAKAGDSLIVRLEAGDDILASLEAACHEHGIQNAEVTGIGSVESPTLAHYRKDTKHFTERAFDGIYEIISLTGNVGLVDGKPVAHCHIAISDDQMQVWGGHLKAGACSATVELVVRRLDSDYSKQFDQAIGLKLWRL
jgi:predicted DNA-binding protein with PD1-like motif